MKRIPLAVWLCSFVILTIVSAAGTARATLDDAIYSDTDKVAFAFIKFGHFAPDYTAMVKASAAYDKAEPIDKVELLREGVPRLDAGYQQYDPDQDLIRVMADVKIMRPDEPAAKSGEPQPAGKPLKLIFAQKSVTFPFAIGAMWVDLIPADFEPTTTLHLTDGDYTAALQFLGMDSKGGNNIVPAVVEMRLRPLGVDLKHPGNEMGEPAWPMLSAVKQLTIWDKARQHIVWSYDAPGYESRNTRQLNNLYIK